MDNALIYEGLGILVERLASKLIIERIYDFRAGARVCTMCNLKRFLMCFLSFGGVFIAPAQSSKIQKPPTPTTSRRKIALDFFADARGKIAAMGGVFQIREKARSKAQPPPPLAPATPKIQSKQI